MTQLLRKPPPPGPKSVSPNSGPQERFLEHDADILFMGGAAGGSKTYSLLMDPLRYVFEPHWHGILYRRTYPEITNPGGLWDEAVELYQKCFPGRIRVNQTARSITFPSGADLTCKAMQHEKDVYGFQGMQVSWLGYDEGTHFTWKQFLYPMTRVRSKKEYKLPSKVRVTTNPDAGSWLAELLKWWIDQDTGYAIAERSGVVRWLWIVNDKPVFFAKKREARAAHPELAAEGDPQSFSFIPASVDDTPQLQGTGYKGKLLAQTLVERERLLKGNWKITASDGMMKPEWFKIVPAVPMSTYARVVRYWDIAATEPKDRNDPDYTAGSHLGIYPDGKTVDILDVRAEQRTPDGVRSLIRSTADQDGPNTLVCIEEEGGASGKFMSDDLRKLLRGFAVEAGNSTRPTRDKVTRAMPLAAAIERGECRLVRGEWNNPFISQAVRFPFGNHDDQVDSAAAGYSKLVRSAPRDFVGGRP